MKNSKRILTFAFVVIFSLSTALSAAGAEQKKDTVASEVSMKAAGTSYKVTASQIKATGAKAIQAALTEAQETGTSAKPSTVTVDPGTYDLDRRLYVGSNTILILKDVTLNRKTDATNIIKVGNPENYDQVTGYYYKNITIKGGTLDGKNLTGTVVSVGHVENFTMEDVTVKNTKDTHLMETGGVYGITIRRCTFKDQSLKVDTDLNTYESIQLDILCQTHFGNYRSEDLTTKDVVIDDCTFSNVPRAIGSHTGVLNNPMTNITIKNCHFDNIKSVAIQGQNWTNCTISNNTITNSPRGIAIYSMRDGGQGTYYASMLASEGNNSTSTSNKYKTPEKDQGIRIMSNKITLNTVKDPYADYARAGILVSGGEVKGTEVFPDKSGKLPKGNYYASGAVISNNTITTSGHGIRLSNARNTRIENNKVTFGKVADSDSYYGIQTTLKSTGNTIKGNEINKADTNGIYLFDGSSAKEIVDNTVNSPKKYGIDVEKSKATKISDNTIKDASVNGIYVYDNASVTTIEKNTISAPKKYGIDVDKSKAGTISANTIKSTALNGIYANNGSAVTTIKKNKISDSKKYGIDVEKSSAKNISSNVISKSAVSGIYIYNGGKSTDIKDNTISGSKKYGIGVNTKSSVTNVTGNKVSNTKDLGIAIGNAKVSRIESNIVSKAKTSGIKAYSGSTVEYVKNNTIQSPGEFGIYFSTKSKGTEISANFVSGGKAEKIKVTKDSKVNKIKENNILTAPKLSKASIVKGGIKITWKKVSKAKKYIIYRKSGSSGWKKVGTTKATKYTDKLKSSQKGKKFTYTVAVQKKGSSNLGYNTKGKSIVYKPKKK